MSDTDSDRDILITIGTDEDLAALRAALQDAPVVVRRDFADWLDDELTPACIDGSGNYTQIYEADS